MKKILLIGGCGYIGSALRFHFKKLNFDVHTVDLEYFGNFNNSDNLSNFKTDYDLLSPKYLDSFDVVVLTAANSSVQLCSDLYDTFNNNVIKFVNLMKKLNKQKFIYASSSCVYVASGDEEKNENSSLNPMDGLTLTKTTIDHFAALSDVEFYGLRFGSVNGWSPNTRLDLMINSMTFSAMKTNQVNVFNGQVYRPILSINDLCRGIEAIICSDEDKRGIYNLASFNENVTNIGKKVAELTNSEFVDKGKTFTYDFKISSNKFIETFNFKFEDGIENIVNSLLVNPTNNKWAKRENF